VYHFFAEAKKWYTNPVPPVPKKVLLYW